ncbi:acyl-CoA thioesterase [Leptospira sp. 2 VSF19]|uniref:Acyl-CoA thioesterase n=1 Tax=Leptospira soteropolitanensis TaxID=2950025 RepID=A0AAW5VE90_9LEPT|nr:acyl-CoA thioesterase [Leptospira soteropolitanensis]MCW7493493.1 acyl-CoA thioesterase [Leptospira soteropolitanensis]MCW7500975.1 acyl-CoA thioesterase [Leptospira soteropolitanensis]MCW7523345.1 acyl-CoA thioesterase [Leptospira soteropolitanensis]MCW7527206.1 acyl-CoA thioesterase [Leptospira soteropolitanensis]MCW7531063.1 acyl-CoA thioesterase [Leptospira soteropolitanensis]
MIQTDIQIRFNDMDPMRRVNNASYSAYLELARLDFCNRYLSVSELEDIPFVLARVEMDLIASVLPGTSIYVETWVSSIGTTSWEFSYEIRDKRTNKVYVKAKTVQVYFDYRAQTKKQIPLDFLKSLEKERL